jgi:hypothetical protein
MATKSIQPSRVRSLFSRLVRVDRGGIVGEHAAQCLRDARTRVAFADAERKGLVRLVATDENESYFCVYGEPETERERERIINQIMRWGCVYVESQWRADEDAEWEHADGVGMCIYRNPLDPDENSYVDDLMRSALDDLDAHVERERFAVGASD